MARRDYDSMPVTMAYRMRELDASFSYMLTEAIEENGANRLHLYQLLAGISTTLQAKALERCETLFPNADNPTNAAKTWAITTMLDYMHGALPESKEG